MPCYQRTIAQTAKLTLADAKRLTKAEIRTLAKQLLAKKLIGAAKYHHLIGELDACVTEQVRERERVT